MNAKILLMNAKESQKSHIMSAGLITEPRREQQRHEQGGEYVFFYRKTTMVRHRHRHLNRHRHLPRHRHRHRHCHLHRY